jgi:lysine-N-methylase
MKTDEEGDVCFPLNGGRCPFLDDENLCEIHRQLGEQATSVTCREHPRFTEDYGSFREVTLSASCPAANALLLGSEEPLEFVDIETEEPEEEGDLWLEGLLPLRERMLQLLADRTMPLYQRLRRFLLLAAEAQKYLDEDETEALPALAECWQSGEEPVAEDSTLISYVLSLLGTMEILEPEWKDLLRKAETVEPAAQPEALLERIAVYFAFRYLLKCVNDGDLLSRAQMVVLAVLVVERLAAVCGLPEALRRFSCEMEHSDENLETLQEALCYDEALSFFRFLGALRQ